MIDFNIKNYFKDENGIMKEDFSEGMIIPMYTDIIEIAFYHTKLNV